MVERCRRYVLGGEGDSDPSHMGLELREVEVYDPDRNEWQDVPGRVCMCEQRVIQEHITTRTLTSSLASALRSVLETS